MRMRDGEIAACALGLALTLALAPAVAHAETASEVRAEVASAQASLDELAGQIAEGEAQVAELQGQVDALAAESVQLQSQIIEDRDRLAQIVATSYKENADARTLALLLSSQSMDELISQAYYAQKVSDWQAECIEQLNEDKEQLDLRVARISRAKDEQRSALAELTAQREELDAQVSTLTARAEELEGAEREAARQAAEEVARRAAEEQAAREAAERARQEAVDAATAAGDLAPAATAAGTSAPQEAASAQVSASQPASQSGSGWITCVASAYTIADNTPPGSTATASGIPLNDAIPTVAMPISMNPSRFYGCNIEISYGGTSVIATVTDCGGMGGGSRGLDLTPAVFRAFGASSADEWGLRTVSYRFL